MTLDILSALVLPSVHHASDTAKLSSRPAFEPPYRQGAGCVGNRISRKTIIGHSISPPLAGGAACYMGIRVSKAREARKKSERSLTIILLLRWLREEMMANTKLLSSLSDQVLIQKFKQFRGIDRDLVLRVLKRRFSEGSLRADLPNNLRQVLKKKI